MRHLIFLLPLLLSACHSSLSDDQRQTHEKQCLAQGYGKGSPEFLQCLEIQEQEARDLEEKRRVERRRARNAKRAAPQQGQRVLEW